MLVTTLYLITLLPFATFFGIAVYMFIAPIYDKLSATSFVEYFQKVDPYMRVWAKFLVLGQILLSLVLIGLQAKSLLLPQGMLTMVAFLCGVVSLVIAVKGNVPLNGEMEQWDAKSPPAHWAIVRDRWLRIHKIRGVVEIAGFIALLLATMLHVAQQATAYSLR
jgi:hypothetical protein